MTRCFVIGPIGDEHAAVGSPERERYEDAIAVYEHVILAACSQVGIEAIRADHIAKPGEITEQVFRHLFEDEVVVADVSGGNPNVMYELGLRHTRNLLTIQVGEYGQLPFDIHAVRTIAFSRSSAGLVEARKRLVQALTVGLAEGGDPVTATRVWSRHSGASDGDGDSGVPLDAESTGLDLEIEDLDEAGFLDRMVTIEEVFPRLSTTVGDIAVELTSMGTEAEDAGREMDVLNSSQAPASARLAATGRFASVLQGHADRMGQLVSAFESDMDEIDGGVNGVLEFLRENPEQIASAREFLDALRSLAASAREGMEGIGGFGSVVQGLGAVSKTLRRPGQQLSDATQRMTSKSRLMDEWESAATKLLKRHTLDAAASDV